MITKTNSIILSGFTGTPVQVEVSTTDGLPGIHIIGLASKAVCEAKERITSALYCCDVKSKPVRTLINLAPATVSKTSSCLDLAICCALLKQYIPTFSLPSNLLILGECGVDGEIKPLKQLRPLLYSAQTLGFTQALIPAIPQDTLNLFPTMKLYTISHLKELLTTSFSSLPFQTPRYLNTLNSVKQASTFDEQVVGQLSAKRGLQIAAAGHHHILLAGPAGCGKTQLARTLPNLLPPLTQSQVIETLCLYDLAQKSWIESSNSLTTPPFRSPHHTSTTIGLLGGGNPSKPGEVSLAHNGVLFIDESAEFPRSVLDSLRQPLETGWVEQSKATGTTRYPASFLLAAASNLCPCGKLGTTTSHCSCTASQIYSYQKRLSGPFLDRIDLHVFLEPISAKEQLSTQLPVSHETHIKINDSIATARQIQTQRYKNTPFKNNAFMNSKYLSENITLPQETEALLTSAQNQFSLSNRAIAKCIKVAQTIADLDTSQTIQTTHILEALSFRSTSFHTEYNSHTDFTQRSSDDVKHSPDQSRIHVPC